jgi:hypothetical protein
MVAHAQLVLEVAMVECGLMHDHVFVVSVIGQKS